MCFYSSPVNRTHHVFLFQPWLTPCQNDSPCVNRTRHVSTGLTMCQQNSPCVNRTCHVSTGLTMCHQDSPCVNRTHHVSTELAMCQQDLPCVNRTRRVSKELIMCQQFSPCVNRTRHVSLVWFPFKLREYMQCTERAETLPPVWTLTCFSPALANATAATNTKPWRIWQ